MDDSIVVMENIFRHIHLGEEQWQAALNGTREVTMPIVTSTLTTIAVFAPLAIIGGFIGVIFVPFALTVTYALLASLLVALTVVPVLGSLLIKQGNHRNWQGSWPARTYASLLQWSLAHKGPTLLLALALFVASIAVVRFIPVSFLPNMGQAMLSVEVAVPGAASANDVIHQLDQVEAILEQARRGGAVNVYQSNIGGSRMFGQGSGRLDTATILVQLPEGTDVEETAAAFRRDLAGQGRTVTVSQASGDGMESNNLELTLRGEDHDALVMAASELTTALQGLIGLVNVRNDAITTPGAPGDSRLASISRVDGQLAITVSGTITERNTGAVQRRVQQIVDQVGMPSGVEMVTGGVFADINQAFSQMAVAMVMGVVLVYVVMVVSQRSLVTPSVIIFSLPLASVGALGGLLITQHTLGLPALIGMLMLIGLVVTNAIVLIAFVEQLRTRGLSVSEALVQGGRTRLRPILMTALTTIFVLMPIALELGGQGTGLIGAELATVVIGGLVTATLLTLVVIPTVYSLLRKKPPKTTPDAMGGREWSATTVHLPFL